MELVERRSIDGLTRSISSSSEGILCKGFFASSCFCLSATLFSLTVGSVGFGGFVSSFGGTGLSCGFLNVFSLLPFSCGSFVVTEVFLSCTPAGTFGFKIIE